MLSRGEQGWSLRAVTAFDWGDRHLGVADPPCCDSGPAEGAEASPETVSCASSVAAQLASRLKASADLEPGSAV